MKKRCFLSESLTVTCIGDQKLRLKLNIALPQVAVHLRTFNPFYMLVCYVANLHSTVKFVSDSKYKWDD